MTAELAGPNWRDADFWLEVVCLILAAPLLYFPARFGAWAVPAAIGLLAVGWLWRRRRLGCWLIRTSLDWPLLLLFVVMLPLAIWVAPPAARAEYAVPRALILLWNLCLFWLVVIHSARSVQLRSVCASGFVAAGVVVALGGLLGTQWASKVPLIAPVVDRLPHILVGMFAGAEEGFSPNQLAGSLLYVLPFCLTLFAYELYGTRRTAPLLLLGLASLLSIFVLIISQSRAGYVGLAGSLLVLTLGPWRWGRRLLYAGIAALFVGLLTLPLASLLKQMDASTNAYAAAGGVNMAARLEIWSSAVQAIGDYPYTGMGLGTFRAIAPLVYPLFSIPITYDIAHAHNFFLQTALDLGLPGLVAVLAIYLLAVAQSITLWWRDPFAGSRPWALGLAAALAGQAIYSLADAVALGAKTNFLFWFLLALLAGAVANLYHHSATKSR